MTRSSGKRAGLKERRRQRQQQERRNMLLIGGGVVLVILAIIILPTIYKSLIPAAQVGDFKQITPVVRPQENGTSMGDPNAPVKIDSWEDFQCPACQQYTESVEPQILETYIKTGKVYYSFHHYPFIDTNSTTKESHQAANASMCASEQGRFWDYRDIIFANWQGENQGYLADKRLTAFAQSLGLDMTKFNACFKANKYSNQIEADFAKGQSMGVTGTPSVLVNGVMLRPGFIPSFEDVKQAVDKALTGK